MRIWTVPLRAGAIAVAAGFVLLFTSVLCPREAEAQQEVEVVLGSDLSIPGGESYLPLMLTARGVKVGEVVSEVSFPKDVLSFTEAKRGEAAEQSNAEIKAEVKEAGENSALAVLLVTISAANGVPEGLLATLKFRVSASAETTEFRLKNVVKVKTPSGEEIKEANGNEATLTISPPTLPSVGCFFFTH